MTEKQCDWCDQWFQVTDLWKGQFMVCRDCAKKVRKVIEDNNRRQGRAKKEGLMDQ